MRTPVLLRLVPCCLVAVAGCTRKPAPVTPRDPPPPTESSEAPRKPSDASTKASVSGAGGHCLFIEPEHRVVRCYWKREACEEQLAFNSNNNIVKNQKCVAAPEPYCFDERGQPEACYPTAADCEATVEKFKKRNRSVSACVARRGPR